MWVNRYSYSSEVYAKLAQKYSELDKINQEDKQISFEKTDTVELSLVPKNYDEQDYKRVLEKFKQRDSEVKTHEQAHASNANTTAPISYNYQVGPDGKLYATGGHVRLDTSIPKDEKEASFKLDQLQKAASSNSELSSADAQIARTANLNKMLILSQGGNYANQ